MLFRESETVEMKEVVVDDIKKEIIAFANCDGGKLYIGIRDDGTVAGLDNPDGVSLQINKLVAVICRHFLTSPNKVSQLLTGCLVIAEIRKWCVAGQPVIQD